MEGEPTLIDGEGLRFADDDGAFDDVLQFANISRPGVGAEQFESIFVDSLYSFSGFPGVAIDEIFHEHRDVVLALAERWNLDGEHVDAVKEVSAKRTCCDRGFQVTIGSSDHAHVGSNGAVATDAIEFALLQHAQEGDLSFRGKLTDFIQENCSALGKFEFADAALQRTGESAFLVTE